ncbi:cuticle protein 19-like [Penaeus indicus]|uniref:cuticle protein 19-like n=1 Tax=Penaeus indicus TaxID=29960 RepID=UPI00300D43D9
MFTKAVVALALVAVAAAAPSLPAYGYAPQPTYEVPAKYDFNYAVKDDYSGNDFGHQEARDGYDTQGSYYVLLPDGRLQKTVVTLTLAAAAASTHSQPAYGYAPQPTYECQQRQDTWPRSTRRVRPSISSISLHACPYLRDHIRLRSNEIC